MRMRTEMETVKILRKMNGKLNRRHDENKMFFIFLYTVSNKLRR